MNEPFIAAGLCGAILGGFLTVLVCNANHDAAIAKIKRDQAVALRIATAEAMERGKRSQAEADRIAAATATKEEAQKVVYRTITKEVPRYVTAETDNAFALAMGLVRVHDAAFSADPARLGESPGVDNDSASGVKNTDAAAVFAWNGEVCNEAFIRLDGAQDYIRSQLEVFRKSAKSAH